MPTIPSLTTWGPTGTITATVVNNNFASIRTYVNTYAAFKDAANTFTASQTFTGNILTGTHNTYSLGATAARFSNIYAQGAIYTATRFYVDAAVSSFTNGSLYRDSTYGFMVAGVTGSTADCTLTDNGGNPRLQVLTSTGVISCPAGLTAVGITSTNGLTVNSGTTTVGALTSGAITATGNSTITGTLGGVTTLSCTTVTATNLGGALTTAAQTGVTSLGTLTALTVSGVSILQLTGGGAKIAEAASTGNFWVGPQSAVTTSATAGMLIMPGCNGTPTGSFSLGTNGFPMVIDYSTSKIFVNFNGTWRATAALT